MPKKIYIYKRLKNKKSTYNIANYLKDYELNQYYKRNDCKYPCVNFYKQEEKNSRNRNKKILSFDEKRKKKIMCRTDSDYFPKITKTMTTRNSSANNSVEEFGNIKANKRVLKERKKKFINFNKSDLKL